MIAKSFDELEEGARVVSRGRTITETDVVSFCYLTGNWLEIHSNVELAKRTEFGQRLVQGSLVFSLIPGLLPYDAQYVVAFYGVDRIRFLRPVFIGDTIRVVTEVTAKTVKDDSRGVVDLGVQVLNQRDEVVQVSTFRLMVRRQALDARASG